jgi:hypothetical protein
LKATVILALLAEFQRIATPLADFLAPRPQTEERHFPTPAIITITIAI